MKAFLFALMLVAFASPVFGADIGNSTAPMPVESASDALDDTFDDSGEFIATGLQPVAIQLQLLQPIAIQLQSCPGGRCAVPAAASSSVSAPARGSTFAPPETPSFAAARPRLFANKPVRTMLGRLFGRGHCR